MRFRYIVAALLMLLSTQAFCRPQARAVVIDTVTTASVMEMLHVVDSFFYQFQACPDSLFGWAYLGLEDKKENPEQEQSREGRSAIQLVYNDRIYDPDHKLGDVAIDIYVLGVRWWKDQHLVTQAMLTFEHPDHPLTAHMTAKYSGSILESGDIIFVIEPIADGQTRVHYEFRLTFGRVLSAFISDKTWQNAIEWRFVTILENLIECAETGTVQPKFRGPQK